MTSDNIISAGIFDGFSWIRCEGKGSFLNSPVVKAFGDARIHAGETMVVVDLAACTGMDSTFMGTLAGMAARLSTQGAGVLQIAEPGSRNLRSLEDLGLDHLMEIDPPDASWRGELARIRSLLGKPDAVGSMNTLQRAQHVLEAHQTLSDVNEKNAREFSGVVSTLQDNLFGARDACVKKNP